MIHKPYIEGGCTKVCFFYIH